MNISARARPAANCYGGCVMGRGEEQGEADWAEAAREIQSSIKTEVCKISSQHSHCRMLLRVKNNSKPVTWKSTNK